MSTIRSLYDELCEAAEDVSGARRSILAIAREVGVDLYSDVDGGDVWSHSNLLRVVRAVQGMRLQLAVAKGYPVQRTDTALIRRVPAMKDRGW